MDEEPQKFEVELGTVTVHHKIDFDWLALGIICLILWAPCWWYDAEIRCALGSEKACVSLKATPPKQ